MALLTFTGVSKRYRRGRHEVVVLDDVSFEVDRGDFVGISGTSRSGKTTLLRIAAGLELADAGTVTFAGHDVGRMSPRARARLLRTEIGFASSERRFTRNERVVDHVAVPLWFAGSTTVGAEAEARKALALVGAESCADASTIELSPGEQTRVALAQALVRMPSLLLVDEPLLTPSPAERDDLKALLKELAQRPGLTVAVASSDIAAIRSARRAWRIGDGRVRTTDQSGTLVAFPGRASSAGRVEQT